MQTFALVQYPSWVWQLQKIWPTLNTYCSLMVCGRQEPSCPDMRFSFINTNEHSSLLRLVLRRGRGKFLVFFDQAYYRRLFKNGMLKCSNVTGICKQLILELKKFNDVITSIHSNLYYMHFDINIYHIFQIIIW